MPRVERKGRANKKRGKKGGKKEQAEEKIDIPQDVSMDTPQQPQSTPNTHEGPAGIVFNDQHFQAAHFGEVDEELLGYFKNVEQTLDDPHFETGEGKVALLCALSCEENKLYSPHRTLNRSKTFC